VVTLQVTMNTVITPMARSGDSRILTIRASRHRRLLAFVAGTLCHDAGFPIDIGQASSAANTNDWRARERALFLLGGFRHHVQDYNRNTARLQAGLLFLATIAILIPSMLAQSDATSANPAFTHSLSVGLSILLIITYALGLVFSLKTHRELFASVDHGEAGEPQWPFRLALVTLAAVTVLVALVSEVFVESVQQAAVTLGITPAFVGVIVVALVGGAAEMISAFSAARKNKLDLSVGIALGSAAQIALFVAPVLVLFSYVIGPAPMDLQFWPGAVAMTLIAAITASLVTNSGRSAWFLGALIVTVYIIFGMTLYLLPPRT
jgi:Ca2+:H+ antiporter